MLLNYRKNCLQQFSVWFCFMWNQMKEKYKS